MSRRPQATTAFNDHGLTDREVQNVLQSMLDHLDGIPPLKREVLTGHLVPRKMTYCELKQDILIPLLLTGIAVSMLGLLL